MQLTMGVHVWFSSLEKPQHSRRVMCCVRYKPGLELMQIKVMLYRMTMTLFRAHMGRSNVIQMLLSELKP